MSINDRPRFEVEAVALFGDRAEIQLNCTRCTWATEIDDPLTLAELNQRADEHAEVCR